MSESARQITMVAFMQAQNCSNYIGSWRHPASQSDFLSPKYYQRIARILEDGKFHIAFFDDRLVIHVVRAGHRRADGLFGKLRIVNQVVLFHRVGGDVK